MRRMFPQPNRLRLSVKQAAVFLALVCTLFVTQRVAQAQSVGGITGTVTDSSGAVVAGANVTITNNGTSVVSKTVTSSAGTYSVTGLNAGQYTVVVEGSGFKKAVQNGVNVEVSTIATIDINLALGAASESVEVTSDAIALNTTQPQLGSTIEPEVVAALPNEVSGRGRQIDQLQFTAPGTTGSTFSHRIGGGVDFEQEIIYNGIPAPQPETEGYTTNFNPPFEMVQEFRVERSTFAAQFGLGQGVLTYQMASGTNRYHGDLFEINRNSLFDSVGFFHGPYWNSANPKNKPSSNHQNNYGFTVGGPIRIPHLYDGRDKTFGHYSQEWYKRNDINQSAGTVPTAAMKAGDFSNFLGSVKQPDGTTKIEVIPIIDPLTNMQFQCNGVLNVICPDRISPLSQTLLQYLPDPDQTGSGIGNLDNNKSYINFVTPTIQHVWGFTIDQNLTQAQSIHFSMWHNSEHNVGFDNAPIVNAPNPLNSLRDFPAIGSGYLLNYNNALTPHLAMSAGIGWIGEINNQFNLSKYSFPGVQDGTVPVNITFNGEHAPTSWGTNGANTGSVNRKLGISIVNNWLWTKGRKTFNIGGEFRRTYQDDNEEQTAGGQFNFAKAQTSLADPNDPNFTVYGSSFATFLLGIPNSANRANSAEERLRNVVFSPYLQDDIKFSPKLTFNLGLRWDIQVPFTENSNRIVFLNPNGTDPYYGGHAGVATKFGNCDICAGYTRADTHFTHLGPRVGFAYKINNKSVVQGGFAIAFLNGGAYEYGTNKVAVNDGNLLVGTYTRNATGNNKSAVLPVGATSWDGVDPALLLPNPAATPFTKENNAQLLGRGTQIMAFNRNDGYAPYAQQWNLNYQRELPYNMFMTVAWLGNRVIHLPSQLNKINQMDPKYLALGSDLNLNFQDGSAQKAGYQLPYPNFVNDFGGSATVAQSLVPFPQYSNVFNNFEGSGTAYYQSIQLEVEKRFSNGLSFLAGYTLSHQLDNTSSGFSSFANGGMNKYNQKPEWAVSNADEPQTLKASGTYELPIGPKKKFFNNHGVTGQIAGGWQVSWILDYEAGTAFGVYEDGTPFPNGFNRPNRDSSKSLKTASYSRARDYFLGKTPVAQMFDQGAFTLTPTQYVLGNALRNYGALRNPPYYNEDFGARKKFFFGERFTGILQLDYFNAFNRTLFNGPNTDATSGTFGQVTNTGSNIDVRRGQATFRLEF